MQMAQGNQALARLYTQLLARYEERRDSENFQREMYGYKSQDADKRAAEADNRWYDRTTYAHNLRYPPDAPTGPNLLGPGAGPSSVAPPATPAAAPQAAPVQRPSVYSLPNPYDAGSRAGVNAPAAPARTSSNAGAPGMDAYAQASAEDVGTSGATDFSSQSRMATAPTAEPPRTGVPSVTTPPRPYRREPTSITQLPTQQRVTPRTAQTKPNAQYLPIDQKWLDLMHQQEDKYGLPRGSMITLLGVENGGGRVFGRNKSGSAEGIFQFHQALRAEHKLSDEDTRNPEKMIPAAAYNLRRNADILKENYKIELPNTPETIPVWVALHQWGSGAGPRIVASYLQNPDAPMISIMGTHKDAKGNTIPNYNVLAANGIEPTSTVKQAIQNNKGSKWYNAYVQEFPDHANQPVGKYQSAPSPQPAQPASPQTGVSDPNAPPRPPMPITGRYGVRAPVEQFINDIRARYPQIQITSAYRDPTHNARVGGAQNSQHMHRNAFDASLAGLTPEQKQDVIARARAAGAMGLGNYGGDSIHLDWRHGGPVIWGPNRSHTSIGATPRWFQAEAIPHARGMPPSLVETAQRPAQPASPPQAQQPSPQAPVKVAGPPMYPEVTPALSRIPTDAEFGASMKPRAENPYGDVIPPPARTGAQAPPSEPILPAQPAVPLPQPRPPALGQPPLPLGIMPTAGAMTGAPTGDVYAQKPPEAFAIEPSALGQGAGIRPNAGMGTTPQSPFPPATVEMPMPPERPSEGGDLGDMSTPADAKLPADDYGSYFEMPMPQRRPIEPEFTPPDRSNEGTPVALNSGIFTEPEPLVAEAPQMPPQPDVGVRAKPALPDDFASAAPNAGSPDPMLSATATPRAALPPGFKVPLPALDGSSMGAAASAPTNQTAAELTLPDRLPPPKMEEQYPDSAPTIQRILDAIYSGKLPNMGTATDPNANNQAIKDKLEQFKQYGGEVSAAAGKVQTAPNREQLEQIGEWLKQNFGPGAAPDKQQAFNKAMQDYVQSGVGAMKEWWNRPKPDATPQATPPKAPAQAAPPARTMPDGRPYIPPVEPLVVPMPKGRAGPTNTTLSAPQQGASPLPAPPGKINPLTGRPDIPVPVKQPDGTVLYTEPGEAAPEQ